MIESIASLEDEFVKKVSFLLRGPIMTKTITGSVLICDWTANWAGRI